MTTVDLQKYEIRNGAFADILIDTKSKRAFKLFKSYDHPHLNGTGKEDLGPEKTNKYRREVFKTELEAYLIAERNKIIKKHTPQFYKQHRFDKVFNANQDISHYYLLDCCFEMDYVEGECKKLTHIRSNRELLQDLESSLKFKLTSLLSAFNEAGIKYTEDSSIIINSHSFVIVDFATIDPHSFEPIIGID